MAKLGFATGAVPPSQGHSSFEFGGKIDYRAVAADLLARSRTLLPAWFPQGKWNGKHFLIGDLHGSKGESLSINSETGIWKDFADEGIAGGDLLSLYARMHGIPMHEAADDLTNGNPPRALGGEWGAPEPVAAPQVRAPLTRDWKVPSPWQSQNVCHHFQHGKPSNKWAYLNSEGKLIGYVARYDPPTGKKQFCPWTWDGSRWQMKKWQGIQPIYGAELLAQRPSDPVLIVEGEKACDAARKIVGDEYVCITWPGGSNAWQDVDWPQLAGRAVLIWPDADKAGKQAAAGIAGLLAPLAAQLATLDVAGHPDGWDAADALADGWERPKFDAWVKDQFGGNTANVVELPAPPAPSPIGVEIVKAEARTPYPKREPPAELLIVPGMVGRMVEYIMECASRPQMIYSVATALTVSSTLMGRRYRSNNNNYTSCYFTVLGKSATGKEQCKTSSEVLLTAAGMPELIGPSRYTSDSALVAALVSKPTHLHVTDELGLTMDQAKMDRNGLSQGLKRLQMETFGRLHGILQPIGFADMHMDKAKAEKVKNSVVHRPALSILAMSTQDTFFHALGSAELRNGFLNRFVVMECTAERAPSRWVDPLPPPPELVEWMRRTRFGWDYDQKNAGDLVGQSDSAHDLVAPPWEMAFEPAAKEAFDQFELDIIAEQARLDPLGLAEMWGRAREISMRLSMVVAQSCRGEGKARNRDEGTAGSSGRDAVGAAHPIPITRFHAEWAIAFVRHFTEQMINNASEHVADSAFDAAFKDMERVIYSAGQRGLTLREIRQHSRKVRSLPPPQQRDLLILLAQEGAHRSFTFLHPSGQKRTSYVHEDFLPEAEPVPNGDSGDRGVPPV